MTSVRFYGRAQWHVEAQKKEIRSAPCWNSVLRSREAHRAPGSIIGLGRLFGFVSNQANISKDFSINKFYFDVGSRIENIHILGKKVMDILTWVRHVPKTEMQTIKIHWGLFFNMRSWGWGLVPNTQQGNMLRQTRLFDECQKVNMVREGYVNRDIKVCIDIMHTFI